MVEKVAHWKKLDHIVFLLMGIPIMLGVLVNDMHGDVSNMSLFIVIGVIWFAVMIIDQLEEK